MTELIMPNDTNPLGNLMGGNLMRWMDIAGGICAAKHAGAHVVTASVDHVSFRRPIALGDVIKINASVTRAFNTSVEIFIEVSSSNAIGGEVVQSNHAYMTFVALNSRTMRPTKIPNVVPKTEKEIELFEGASRRREVRLVLSGRMSPGDAVDLKAYLSSFPEK